MAVWIGRIALAMAFVFVLVLASRAHGCVRTLPHCLVDSVSLCRSSHSGLTANQVLDQNTCTDGSVRDNDGALGCRTALAMESDSLYRGRVRQGNRADLCRHLQLGPCATCEPDPNRDLVICSPEGSRSTGPRSMAGSSYKEIHGVSRECLEAYRSDVASMGCRDNEPLLLIHANVCSITGGVCTDDCSHRFRTAVRLGGPGRVSPTFKCRSSMDGATGCTSLAEPVERQRSVE